MINESNTPETDALEATQLDRSRELDEPLLTARNVNELRDHARKLERENNRLRDALLTVLQIAPTMDVQHVAQDALRNAIRAAA